MNGSAAPLRVLHVLNELRPSGAETMLESAARHWRDLGFAGEAVSTGTRPGPYAQALGNAGFLVHHVPVGRSVGDLLRFARFLRGRRVDVVHQHCEGRGYWLSLAARWTGHPVLRTVHSNFQFDGNLRWRRRIQRAHLRRLGVRFVAVSPGVARNEAERFANPTTLVWNWLDPSRFAPPSANEREAARSALGVAPATFVLASVGNCSDVKNHAAILQALARLRGTREVLYVHAGIEDPHRPERALARALGVERNAVFLGWVPDARRVLAAADIYVMPSKLEGLSIAALEALALGLPALLADVPGLSDLREIFSTIRYFAPDAASLAAALQAALQETEILAPALAQEQARRCRVRFDPLRGAGEYAAIYRELARG